MGYDDAWEKSVGAHGELEEVAPGLAWVWAPCPGAPVSRNMSVYRMKEGLLIHSAICLDDAEMKKLEAMGEVRFILVPNEGHRIDVKRWKKRYPKADVIAPKSARAKVEEVCKVDATCEDVLPSRGVRIHVPDGMKEGYELVYEVDLERGKRALLVNDVLVTPHPHPPTGFGGAMGKVLGAPGGKPGQARIVRFIFGKDRAKFRAFTARLSEIEGVEIMLCSHGGPMTGDVGAQLRECLPRL